MAKPDLQLLMPAVPAPMIFLSVDGTIEAANAAAEAMFGSWMIGRTYAAVLRQPALLALIEAIYAGDKGGDARYVEAGQAGQTIYRVQATALPEGLLLHFSDITHLREAEEMRRDFVANVSHELRTPLTAILGFIETLRGPARSDPDAQSRFLTIMEDEARRMNRIVSDLLSLSRVEGQERIQPDDQVALNELIASAVAALRPQAEEAEKEIEVLGGETEVRIRGDADQLIQVLMNLLENALKYGGKGEPVTIRLSEDVGTGKLLPRLTERFYRVDTHRSRAKGLSHASM